MTINIEKIINKDSSDFQIIFFPYSGGNYTSYSLIIDDIKMKAEIILLNTVIHRVYSKQTFENMESLNALYYSALKDKVKKKLIVFGHSLGAYNAFLFVEKLLSQTEEKNIELILSGANAPFWAEKEEYKISDLDDKSFQDYLYSIGGISDEIQKEEELLKLFLPVIKNDFYLYENNDIGNTELKIKPTIIYSQFDTRVSEKKVKDWTKYFFYQPDFIETNGGHFDCLLQKNGIISSQINKLLTIKNWLS